MKKIISLLLAVLMLASAIPMMASATAAINFGYRIYGDGFSVFDGTEITGFASGLYNPGNIDIPKKMVGGEVLSIADNAFKDRDALYTVDSMPSTIFNIGNSAFKNCIALTKVSLSTGLTNLGESAFEGCSALKTISIPSGVTVIKANTFSGCSSLESITLPSTITEIEAGAFKGCIALKTITLPSELTSIGEEAFMNCSSLEEIVLPSSLKTIGLSAFEGCTSLQGIEIPDKVTYIEHYTFKNCPSLKTVTIPASVTDINPLAFDDSYNVEDLYYAGTSEDLIIPISGYNVKRHYLYCIPVSGEHEYYKSQIVTTPTCTTEGVKESTCKVCGYVKKDTVEKDPNRHSYGVWERIKEPTCTEKGQEYFDCNCGNYEKYTDIPALGHDYMYYVTYATCTEDGIKHYSCKRCDYTKDEKFADAKGHKDSNHDAECDICQHNFAENCGHICHKGGFWYKLCLFFWKLFKTNKECSCGMYHY